MNRTLFSAAVRSALPPVLLALLLGGILLGGTTHAQDTVDRVDALEQEVADLCSSMTQDGHHAAAGTEIPEGAARVLLELSERGGATGGAASHVVRQGDTVAISVESAVAGELHLHGYGVHWDLDAGTALTGVFEATSTGRFPLEFHPEGGSSGIVVGYLEVRP